MTSALASAKQVYASCAQATGRGLERVGLLPHDPPSREHRLRHWAYSLTRAHDSLGIAALDVPWWTYDAIDAVETWLAGQGDPSSVRAFEWGSGASTLWLARRVGEVHSVEHHRGLRRDDPGTPRRPSQRRPRDRRAGAVGGAGGRLGQGGPRAARLRVVRRPDRCGRRRVLVDRRRRPGARGVPRPGARPPQRWRHRRVRQHAAPPLPAGDRRRPARRAAATGASPRRCPTPTKRRSLPGAEGASECRP